MGTLCYSPDSPRLPTNILYKRCILIAKAVVNTAIVITDSIFAITNAIAPPEKTFAIISSLFIDLR